MTKQYNKLWVFGDSFTTTNYCVDAKDSFWGLTAAAIGAKSIVNCSWPGNCITSICHMLIGLQHQYDWENDFFIIGIPPLARLTVFDNFKDTRHNATHINTETWQSELVQIDCHTGLVNMPMRNIKELAIYENSSWTEVQVLNTLFLLSTWLESKKANYIVANLSVPFLKDTNWAPYAFVLPDALANPKYILHDNTYYSANLNIHKPADFDPFEWQGHHGSAGNGHYFDVSVLPTLKRNGFC